MAIKFTRLVLNEQAFKKFQLLKKRYFQRHNLSKDAKVTTSDIINDAIDFILGDNHGN